MTTIKGGRIIAGDVSALAKYHYSLHEEVNIGSEDNYLLGLTVADDNLAVSLSNFSVQILKLCNSFVIKESVLSHSDTITELKFSPENKNTLFTSSKDGKILSWDMRASLKPVQTFQDNITEKTKPVNCFDIDQNGTFLCGGTDQIREDSFILFWDTRSSKLLGGYWDSHTDDITSICYHPKMKDRIVSGSTDGLINVFDVSQPSEDDALLNTINSESSVAKLFWNEDNIVCMTHTEELQIWNSEELNLMKVYTREKLMQTFSASVDYLVDIQLSNSAECLLVTGNSEGASHIWSLADEPYLWTHLEGGHSDVVRCVANVGNRIITGGEDGLLCLWNLDCSNTGKNTSPLKQQLRKHQEKPY